jgi:hypothetical protein
MFFCSGYNRFAATHFTQKERKNMIRNPILTRFEELSRPLQPAQRDLHSAFLHPDKLPQFV